MNAEIVTIGDEILIGQIIDTNSAFIAKLLNKVGISIYQITSVQDDREHILKALREAESNADLVILTGGLGPTKDDITKHTICEFTDDTLIQNDEVLAHVEHLFKKYISTPISDLNRAQALVPSRAEVLMNRFGTAPGMWINRAGQKNIVILPGVPYEMKALMENEVVPRLRERYKYPYIMHKTLLTYGLGESAIAERLNEFEDSLPNYIKLAYLPNLGRVRLRLSAKNSDQVLVEREMKAQIENLVPLVKDIFVGFEEQDNLVSLIAKALTDRGMTLSVAESCTGGKLSESITEIAGSSSYYNGGIVTYSTESKLKALNVSDKLIKEHSVVSEQVVEAMALGAKRLFNSDYAIATTGNAGPTKGESEADVGTVIIAIATPDDTVIERFTFGNQRVKVIGKAVNKALELLQKEILKKA